MGKSLEKIGSTNIQNLTIEWSEGMIPIKKVARSHANSLKIIY
jgi:hypothetical protein